MRAPQLDRGSLDFNMTPMIDVTFLLIIFFLLSSHFVQQETQLEMQLPRAASSTPSDEDQTRRVTVNVTDDGRVLLLGEAVSPEELRRRMAFEGQKHADGDPLEVRIRCDRRAAYEFVEPVLSACAEAGLGNVSFAVVDPAEGR